MCSGRVKAVPVLLVTPAELLLDIVGHGNRVGVTKYKKHINMNPLHVKWDWLIGFWCLTPLSAIFQLYHGDRF